MTLHDLIQRPHAWVWDLGEASIAVTSRVRLARNLRGAAFPGWAGEEECERIWKRVEAVAVTLPSLAHPIACGMNELSAGERYILFERHLISHEQAEKQRGSGLVLKEDETVAIMVNEEDHLRMQALLPGLRLKEAWARINQVDDEIEKHLDYAFSPRWGYLTACPSNVGTGIRASVMLHLPGLVLLDEMDPIIKGIQKIGLAVRGVWGEGTEASGDMFQISNQMTLGESEEHIVSTLEQVVLELVEHEKNARLRLLDKRPVRLEDHVGRALGILTHAHILTSHEALDLLSALRLGSELGIVKKIERPLIDELLLWTQPAHLQMREGRPLKPDERDIARAELIRGRLAKARRAPRRSKGE